jgi:hypothetical protein
MDTECDVSVGGDTAEARRGICHVRNRLLAEHLGVEAEAVERQLGRLGTLAALIDASADADRTLGRIEPVADIEEPTDAIRNAADPAEPLGFAPELARLLPAGQSRDGVQQKYRAVSKSLGDSDHRSRARSRSLFMLISAMSRRSPGLTASMRATCASSTPRTASVELLGMEFLARKRMMNSLTM